MRTKILGLLATTFVILAFSGCDFFNSKEGQTSVIKSPEGTVESEKIYTKFPAGSSGQLITITHKDNNGGADDLDISYRVTDSNGDGKYDGNDCMGLALRVQGGDVETLYTGVSQLTDGGNQKIWIEADGKGECHNTPFSLRDWSTGGNLALALSDQTPDIITYIGNPGFIKYGTKKSTPPIISQWNITGTEAEVEIKSTYGKCSNGQVWNETTKACETTSTGTGTTTVGWLQHTWEFNDGTTETSYILNRTDNEYFDYISTIDALCSNISKSQFQWKPDAGNDANWQNFGIPDCTDGGVTPPPPGEQSCYTEYNGSEECKICNNINGDTISEECISPNTQPADKKDAERQKKDMQKQLDQHKRDAEKEYPKFKKEMERLRDKELVNKIEKFEKLLKRATSAPEATKFLNKAITWLKESQTKLDVLISDMDVLITSCQAGIQKTQAVVDAIVPGQASWDQLNLGWTSKRKNNESCWPWRNSIDRPYRAIEQLFHELADMTFEISKAVIEIESYDIKVPDFIYEFFEKFEEFQKWIPVTMSCRDNMKPLLEALKNATDQEDIDYALQDIRDSEQDCNWDDQDRQDDLQAWREENDNNLWKYVDRALKVVDENRYVENDKKVLLEIKFKIEALAELQNEVKTDDSFVLEHLKNIERLKEEALPLVNEAIKAAESGDYVEWEQLDILKQVLRESLNVIGEYCNRVGCPFSDEVREVVYSEYYPGPTPTGPGGPDGPYPMPMPNFQDKFGTYFDEEFGERFIQILTERIANEVLASLTDSITKMFNEITAEKIAYYLEKGDENLTILLNKSEFLGDDRTKFTVENTVELNDVLEEFETLKNEGWEISPEVTSVVNEWKGLFLAQNIKNDVINKFKELLTAEKARSNTGEIIAWLQEKKTDNEDGLAKDRIEFRDSKLSKGDWHAPYFVASSFRGDTDPNGQLTGFVRPGGLINRCEALKIAIEGAGIPKAPGATDWWCSTYVATAEKEGFSMVGYYGDSAYGTQPSSDRGYFAGNPTRAELCRLWVDVGNLEKSRYNDEFKDVDFFDPWAEDAATCKKYEIITGQDGKYFDAHGLANRAEVAAMEVRLQKALRANQLFNSFETGDNTGIFQ